MKGECSLILMLRPHAESNAELFHCAQLTGLPLPVSSSLSLPGQLTCNNCENEMNPKLWVALGGGRVVVFDASSWSLLHDCIQVGESQLVRAELRQGLSPVFRNF